MIHFIPAWYKNGQWRENEQYWYRRRMKTEFDDTVKQIQLFHRSRVYPFQLMLLSYAPNLRHFLHRQSVFRVPYWSCFDAIQEIRRKKVKMFSFHNLNWPENIEFIYSPFALIAMLQGEKYAQVEFAEDGNPIQVDIYQKGVLQRKNIYDDRGFVSSTIVYENGAPSYQDYLSDSGIWKIRHYLKDGHVEVNLKSAGYLLVYQEQEHVMEFLRSSYESLEQVIAEVFQAYVSLTCSTDMYCVAAHELHNPMIQTVLRGRKMILSFFEDRYDIKNQQIVPMLREAAYIITDTQDNLTRIKRYMEGTPDNITDITPFDSRVDLGISQQLTVQKILVPVDDMEPEWLDEIIVCLGNYITGNENARIHLFSRTADPGNKRQLLEKIRIVLKKAGLEPEWAREENRRQMRENLLDGEEYIPVRFVVEQCVDELAVSKCVREQRLIVDMRKNSELYLKIMGISMGIPQIVYRDNQFGEDGNNGRIVKDTKMLADAVSFYLDDLKNWNEAKIYAYELSKKYTTAVLTDKWKEVIEFVGRD